ncbi:MAG: hypothetical protein JNL17_10405 [Cyclobacteriaceae bacterium]|nr:hypothetical protein [Cyclobacteriaceae bacterium]
MFDCGSARKRYHSGYYLQLGGKVFDARDYSDQLIRVAKLRLISSNYSSEMYKIDWEYSQRFNGLEFIIVTDTFEKAQNLLFNVLCAAAVIEGKVTWSDEPHYPHEYGTIDKYDNLNPDGPPILGFSSNSIPEYFYLAILASKDYKLENAIIKFQISTQLYSMHNMDLQGGIDWKTTDYPFIQMRFAYAIISAFSVVEELGLSVNVKVSPSGRSKLDGGEWDEKVLNDLTGRLINTGINLNENISWMIRGEATKTERVRPIKVIKKADWAHHESHEYGDLLKVEDGFVSIPDAINHISFLRSKISSHAVGRRIMDLSVFDVANAQFLARRLILERAKIWKI